MTSSASLLGLVVAALADLLGQRDHDGDDRPRRAAADLRARSSRSSGCGSTRRRTRSCAEARRYAVSAALKGSLQTRCKHAGGHGWRRASTLAYAGMRRRQRRQTGSCASASSTLRSVAAAISSGGTHAGNATSTVRWAPEAVCCSSTAASRSAGKRSATRTSAGQIRRWTSVTLPSIRRVATTSPDSRRRLRTAKISWPDAWPHQLPRIGSPAICSARFGTGPRADCNTTPCSHTQANASTRPGFNHRAAARTVNREEALISSALQMS